MALSNVFREPRRELTEQLVGVVVAAPVIYVWWRLTRIIAASFPAKSSADAAFNLFGAGFIAACGVLAGLGILWLVNSIMHSVGESVCNALARGGIELRPKERR